MTEKVTLDHGSGYRLTHELVRDVFAKAFGMEGHLTDSAILEEQEYMLAFTTDAYVIDPLFFPGGDIGKLAVCGTVNDLAVSGAVPKYISASFIIEEGFPMDELRTVVGSMADEALKAGVKIVTGDTKVVEKGKCDKLFITTSGTGLLAKAFAGMSTGKNVKAGDKLIINGPVGNHAIAVLGARRKLGFSSQVTSDCASLNRMIGHVLDRCKSIHFIRDLTRGGLAVVLNELGSMTGSGIAINEDSVPVDNAVRGLCEILGFDPLYLANEGKVVIVAGEEECEDVLELLRGTAEGKGSEIIGEITGEKNGKVVLNTSVGGTRIIYMPSGLQLPRIC